MRPVRSTRPFHRAALEPRLGQLPKRGSEIVDLDRNVTESVADIDRPILRTMHQLKRDYLLAWELEHGQTCVGLQINPANLLIPERGVEVERGGQIGNAVRGVESPHGQVA